MKRISWISCDSFIDTDLQTIKRLCQFFNIKLFIVIGKNSPINYEQVVKDSLSNSDVVVKFIYLSRRQRSILNIFTYRQIITEAKDFKADVYYISYQGMPYGGVLYKMMLPVRKCVAACHNVSTPQGAVNGKIAVYLTEYWLKCFKNINVFSESQKKILEREFPRITALFSPFFLKDYGKPTFCVDKFNQEKIRFTVFGNIVKYKRIDLLIEAAEYLYDRGHRNFVVRIAGNCKCWQDYQRMIKHPELFELHIRRIPNEDIANLFADSHYAVFPYQDIAQSGSITVAFSYNVPTIVSDIPQFKEFVVDGETSLIFKSQDVNSLVDVMQYAIEHHKDIYPQLCENQKAFVNRLFDDDVIVSKYVDFFNKL